MIGVITFEQHNLAQSQPINQNKKADNYNNSNNSNNNKQQQQQQQQQQRQFAATLPSSLAPIQFFLWLCFLSSIVFFAATAVVGEICLSPTWQIGVGASVWYTNNLRQQDGCLGSSGGGGGDGRQHHEQWQQQRQQQQPLFATAAVGWKCTRAATRAIRNSSHFFLSGWIHEWHGSTTTRRAISNKHEWQHSTSSCRFARRWWPRWRNVEQQLQQQQQQRQQHQQYILLFAMSTHRHNSREDMLATGSCCFCLC